MIHHHLQAESAVRAGHHKPHSQYHIHYFKPQDRLHVSAHSESVLRDIMRRACVHSILIMSTVRSEREQAEVMLHNIEEGINVRYAPAGRSVNAIAVKDIAAGKRHDQIIADMLRQVDKVGFSHVTKHCAARGLNTVDISAHYLKTSHDAQTYGRFVEALRHAAISHIISRFGWPEGPLGDGRCFNDKGCLHVEIEQPASV